MMETCKTRSLKGERNKIAARAIVRAAIFKCSRVARTTINKYIFCIHNNDVNELLGRYHRS